jgi:hypothetical protein
MTHLGVTGVMWGEAGIGLILPREIRLIVAPPPQVRVRLHPSQLLANIVRYVLHIEISDIEKSFYIMI